MNVWKLLKLLLDLENSYFNETRDKNLLVACTYVLITCNVHSGASKKIGINFFCIK